MMRYRFYLVLLILFVSNLSAKLYSSTELELFFSKQSHSIDFINTYKSYDQQGDFLNSIKTNNILDLEYNLYNLLKFIEYSPRSSKNIDFINQMKSFKSIAMKLHEEGNLQIPVFNIQARAQGVENYWLSLDLEQSIAINLDKDYLSGLEEIKRHLSQSHQAKHLAIKNSIKHIKQATSIQLLNYFLNNTNQIKGIEKFVTDFAVEKQSKELINKLNVSLDISDAEYLMRRISKDFDESYIKDKLIEHSNFGSSQKFAMTLLKPFANKDIRVREHLLNSLKSEDLASSSAFALSGLSTIDSLNQLSKSYYLAYSNHEKDYILLALKLNPNRQAQRLFKQLKLENQND